MMHAKRQWCVVDAKNPEELARNLVDITWTLCTGFRIGAYYFLNDSTSEDGAQEYAVLRQMPDGRLLQIESITFGRCRAEEALHYVKQALAGNSIKSRSAKRKR
jgi:hypothetical protein